MEMEVEAVASNLNLAGRKPVVVSAMNGYLLYIVVGVVLVVVGAIVYGFHHRLQKKEEEQRASIKQVVASDAAPSTRQATHYDGAPLSTVNGIPMQPGTNMPGLHPSAVQNAVSGTTKALGDAVRTDMHPFPAGQGMAGQNAQPTQQTMPPTAASTSYSAPPPAQPEVNPIQTVRQNRAARDYERRMAAFDAPTGAAQPTNGIAGSPADPLQADMARLAALSSNPAPFPTGPMPSPLPSGGGSGLRTEEDPNGQAGKRSFQSSGEGDYVTTTRLAPVSPWVVGRGEVIPAGLPNAIVSDLPGDIVAEVKRDVLDSPTHRFVLIPAGSLLAGEYNSAVTYGQGRAQVVWTYLRFPDGTYVDLPKFVGHSADGATGLKDQTDNHLKRLIGGVAMSALFSAGIQISQNRTTGTNSTLAYPSNAQIGAAAAAQQAAEVGQEITSRNLNIQPTLKIRPGDIFAVSVTKSIVFPGPYEPQLLGSGGPK
jgi:type IV secretion system protein VirB10